jgi:hypothetical protein
VVALEGGFVGGGEVWRHVLLLATLLVVRQDRLQEYLEKVQRPGSIFFKQFSIALIKSHLFNQSRASVAKSAPCFFSASIMSWRVECSAMFFWCCFVSFYTKFKLILEIKLNVGCTWMFPFMSILTTANKAPNKSVK